MEDRTGKTAKAIIQILVDNGFSVQEADELLETVKYIIRQQKVVEA